MLRYHMAVVTRDNALKREVKRVTASTASNADFIGDASGLGGDQPLELAIYDARRKDPDKAFLAKVPDDARLMYILDTGAILDKLALFKDERTVSLMGHDERFDDDEFIASATKALRGDVFGLQKYFPWGVTTFSMVLESYEQKNKAIDILLRYAQLAGVRGPVRDRIQVVADELMMNALYHAPVDDEGKERFRNKSLKELAQLEKVPAIQVRYGSTGRYFGISVRDGGGSLTRQKALDYLMRARTGAHIETKSTGAGLGLISVLRSCSKLVFNLDPGHSTEVIALFDIELFARGKVGARSVHMFTQAPGEEEDATEGDEDTAAHSDEVPDLRGSGGKWLLAALLFAVVAAMGSAYYFRNVAPAAAEAQVSPHVTVITDPADAAVTLNGTPITAGRAAPLPEVGTAVIRVEKEGFEPYEESLGPAAPGAEVRVVVHLRRASEARAGTP